MLQDSWRYSFFALGRGGQAFLNDTIWPVVLLPALVLLRKTGHANVFWFVFAWGAAATVAAAVGPSAGPGRAPAVGRVGMAVRGIVTSGPVTSRRALPTAPRASCVNYGVGLILGLAAVGYVQAANTLMGPFMVVFFGMGLVHCRRRPGSCAARRGTCRCSACWSAAASPSWRWPGESFSWWRCREDSGS